MNPPMNLQKNFFVVFLSLICLTAGTVRSADMDRAKKLVPWGFDTSDPTRVKQFVSAAEQQPFNGLILFGCTTNPGVTPAMSIDWDAFGIYRLISSNFSSVTMALNTMNFHKFTDNFIRFDVSTNPGESVDWFDNMTFALNNVGWWAGVAHDAGYKGWAYDLEDYGESSGGTNGIFIYRQLKYRSTKSFSDYAAQVRLRGSQVMQQIQANYPNIVLLLTISYSYVWTHGGSDGQSLDQMEYGLLPSFIDGLLDAAGPQVRFIDGKELSFTNLTSQDYLDQLRIVRKDCLALVAPELHQKYLAQFEAGVGMYADYQFGAYYPTTPTYWPTYSMTPQQRLDSFQENVYWALRTADEYVWLYSEYMSWWETGYQIPTPAGATDAIRAGQARLNQLYVDNVILHDNFTGTANSAVDSTKWTASAPALVAQDGSGYVELDADVSPGNPSMLALGGSTGIYGFEPNNTAFGRLVTLGSSLSGGYTNIGLTTDASGNVEIMMRAGPSYANWYLRVANNGGSDEAIYVTDVSRSQNGDWTIDWLKSCVMVYFNGVLKINTHRDTPTAVSGAGLSMPHVKLAPDLAKWGGGNIILDTVKWGTMTMTCETVQAAGYGLASDLNHDCRVDMRDLAIFAQEWMSQLI